MAPLVFARYLTFCFLLLALSSPHVFLLCSVNVPYNTTAGLGMPGPDPYGGAYGAPMGMGPGMMPGMMPGMGSTMPGMGGMMGSTMPGMGMNMHGMGHY